MCTNMLLEALPPSVYIHVRVCIVVYIIAMFMFFPFEIKTDALCHVRPTQLWSLLGITLLLVSVLIVTI